jgi:hypothetical protein
MNGMERRGKGHKGKSMDIGRKWNEIGGEGEGAKGKQRGEGVNWS